MKYKTILVTAVAMAASAFLVGCGGGGDSAAPTSATPGQAQGIYSGSFVSSGQTGAMNLLVLENDEYWGLYGTTNSSGGLTVYGLIQGQGISNNGAFTSANLKDYSNSPTASGSLSASYKAGLSMSGTGTENGQVGTFSLSSSAANTAAFNTSANLSEITGTWPGSDLSNTPFNLNIGSSGALTGGTTNGCTVSGSITPRSGGKNIFNVALTTASTAACGTAAGATGGGVAVSSVLSSGKRQLLIALVSTDRTKGTVLFANR